MKKINIPIIIFLIAFANLNASMNDTLHVMALRGIDFASSLQFDKAVKTFDQMIEMEPENPRAHFLKSATYFWMYSADMHNEELGEEFKNLSYKAVEVAEARLEKDEDDIDAMFYLGGAYGSLGRYYGIKKSYLNAYWYGKKGVNILEDVVELDSTYYDAYLGLGIYHYLADVLPRFVKVLSFILGIDGDREQGIRELKLVSEKGVYTKSEAMFFLGAIYVYRERDYNKAMHIWDELLEKYPGNPGVLIHLGATYSRMGKCDQAMEVYDQVLASLNEEMLTPVSSIHYQMGQLYFRMNMFDRSIESFMKSIETDTLYSGNRRWTYGWSQFWLGRSYDMIGDTTKARVFYSNIKESDSERVYERAQERLEESFTEIDKEMVIIRNNIDCFLLDSAMIRLDALIRNHDDLEKYRKFEINYYKGQVMYLQNRYNHAIQQFNSLIDDKSYEDNWHWYWSYYYRGKSYLKLGMVERALEDFEIAEESDSNNLTDRVKKEYMKLGL
jgi:tetratricopeptide (TPR) repeat protein